MSLTQWLFAACYDVLNWGVEGRLAPYRQLTAGRARGEVVEIGGGTGANLPFYRPDVRLTMVEPNPHMVSRLRSRAAKLEREVVIVPDLGENLPFSDASIDTVVTTLVLCMVYDLHKVLAEARRVLRPGGTLLFYEHVISPSPVTRKWQARINPMWRFVTTGCNLDRDISGAIKSGRFTGVEVRAFELSVGLPVTIPNIVGVATA